ncbi:MAG: hypothetical protein HQL52_03200 [Magnetococcales bacterium]|nr:hypothetical protein [Magnetococcales bacterium]
MKAIIERYKEFLIPYGAGLGVFGVAFFLLDLLMMNLQGISLFFHQ